VPLDTVRVSVQLPLAGIVPPVSLAVPVVVDKDPEQVVDAAGEVARLKLLGSESVKAA
jgi:hypothetical protein